MKKKLLTIFGLLFVLFFSSCAGNQVKDDAEISNEPLQRKIIITDIPTNLNGMYGDISLAIYDENQFFDWLAWSEPVMINNGSVTNALLVDAKSGKINNPFYEEGEFIIYMKIEEKSNQDLPFWQGYIFMLNITKETTVIQWSEFEEVRG